LSAPALALEFSGIDIAPIAARAKWETLFARVPHPHLTQAWMYGEAKRRVGWVPERLVLSGDGVPLALAQVLVKRVLGVPLARINRGPLFLDAQVSTEARQEVFGAVRRRWRFLRRGALAIAPALPGGDDSTLTLRTAGFIPRGSFAWGSSLIDLKLPLAELHRRLASEWRTKLRKAEKNCVQLAVRTDRVALEWMIARHAENMRAKDFAGPPTEFVRALIDASPGDFVLLQALVGGEPHAATLIARFGQHAENFIGWFDDTARRAAAGNFLMWSSVVEMQRAGAQALDLGGFTVADRYGQFKRGMRGTEYRLSGEWLAF
jgi:CelD/BcsL family acetyltransferase involved in cellulose biosynthesis